MTHAHVAAEKSTRNAAVENRQAQTRRFGVKVRGFVAGAVSAGIKHEDRTDLGIILSEVPCCTAGVFTRNMVKAAPVLHGMKRLSQPSCFTRALLVNSGNANACTGEQGLMDVERLTKVCAKALDLLPEEVLMCSTGVIGEPLPVAKMAPAIERACGQLKEDGLPRVARCIMTTDTFSKEAYRSFTLNDHKVTLYGMAKGAGMIAPDMGPPNATMLCFVLSDIRIGHDFWQQVLTDAVEKTFNTIIVDGDTSTNDTVLALANGLCENPTVRGGRDGDLVMGHLTELLSELARMIVLDGEGATKCVDILVEGALNTKEADHIARTIAQSPLVKTALFGQDPNWGRILAAAGRSGCLIDPEKIELFLGDVQVVEAGMGKGKDAEMLAKEVMKKRQFQITIKLGLGDGIARITTCDLTTEYIRINADYRT